MSSLEGIDSKPAVSWWAQAFGSVSSLEAAYFRETGKQLLLSEQNLMDCAWDYGNTACLGGCDSLLAQTSVCGRSASGGAPTRHAFRECAVNALSGLQ